MQVSSEDEWLRRNRAVLQFLDTQHHSPVLIVRYDDLLAGTLDESLCRFMGRTVDTTFIDPRKRHSEPMEVRQELLDVYEKLNRRFEANREEIAHHASGPGERAPRPVCENEDVRRLHPIPQRSARATRTCQEARGWLN